MSAKSRFWSLRNYPRCATLKNELRFEPPRATRPASRTDVLIPKNQNFDSKFWSLGIHSLFVTCASKRGEIDLRDDDFSRVKSPPDLFDIAVFSKARMRCLWMGDPRRQGFGTVQMLHGNSRTERGLPGFSRRVGNGWLRLRCSRRFLSGRKLFNCVKRYRNQEDRYCRCSDHSADNG
jgi:hypothetical protein